MLNEVVDRWNIHWAILPRRYKKLVALLNMRLDGESFSENRTGVIFVRVSA